MQRAGKGSFELESAKVPLPQRVPTSTTEARGRLVGNETHQILRPSSNLDVRFSKGADREALKVKEWEAPQYNSLAGPLEGSGSPFILGLMIDARESDLVE